MCVNGAWVQQRRIWRVFLSLFQRRPTSTALFFSWIKAVSLIHSLPSYLHISFLVLSSPLTRVHTLSLPPPPPSPQYPPSLFQSVNIPFQVSANYFLTYWTIVYVLWDFFSPSSCWQLLSSLATEQINHSFYDGSHSGGPKCRYRGVRFAPWLRNINEYLSTMQWLLNTAYEMTSRRVVAAAL